jgi:Bacterial HORMA domain family 1
MFLPEPLSPSGLLINDLYYEVRSDGTLTDNRSGGVYARADISGATWFSFLVPSNKWWALTEDQRKQIEKQLPFPRGNGYSPQDGDGYWVTDRSYAWDGIGTQRRMYRPY